MSNDRKESLVHFLENKGARFENGKLTGFAGSATPERHAPALSVLLSQAVLKICGTDAARFLQGQLTSNVETLAPGHYQTSAVCTPKGRMYSSFTLLHTEHSYLLAMHEGLVEATAENLGKYAVFFKTDITPTSPLICLGLSGQGIDDSIYSIFGAVQEESSALKVADGWLIKVPGLCSRYEFWLPVENLEDWWVKLAPLFAPAPEEHWRLLDIETVRPRLPPEALEKYIPQHLNLATLGSVSFRKGCYTGQEIVARMQNLGQLKSRSYRLTATQILQLEPNTRLFNSSGKHIGEILESVSLTNENITEILAVIRVEAVEKNDVHLESGEGLELTVHALPYKVDTRTELQK